MDKAQKEVDLLAKKLELYYMNIEDIKSMLNILLDQYEKTANK